MKEKVLVVDTNPMIRDGITSAIMNYETNIDHDRIAVDFVSINTVDKSVQKKIDAIHGKLYVLSMRNTNTVKYVFELSKLIRKNKYNLVHAHGSSCTLAVEMVASKMAGVPCCPHSHNTSCQHLRAHRMLRPVFNLLYKNGFACSRGAGKWLYGDKKFDVLKNGIDTSEFCFDLVAREEYRKKLGFEDKIVIGHVAHFTPVKNQKFTVELFKKLCEISDDYRLVFVGDGELRKDIQKIVEDYSLTDKVLFTGIVDYVPKLLSAIDIQILPSFYEGFPFTVVEAQASGLKVIASEKVTRDCSFSDLVIYRELDTNQWVDTIQQNAKFEDRVAYSQKGIRSIIDAGYDIKENAKKLTELYRLYGKR